jgi:RNA polymerase sigma factor (TIGR02999 family)
LLDITTRTPSTPRQLRSAVRQSNRTPAWLSIELAIASPRNKILAFEPGFKHTITTLPAASEFSAAERNLPASTTIASVFDIILPPVVQAKSDGATGHRRVNLFADTVVEPSNPAEVTGLLRAWCAGDQSALEGLTALVQGELHRMAHRYMRNERQGHTLQTTALVNEVYIRLVDVKGVNWQHRAQFFAISAHIMRNIMVDAARARRARKRGGVVVRVSLGDDSVADCTPDAVILAVDDALEAFARIAPRQARVVELRYFGGMSEEESAEVLNCSPRTVRRDWQFAKAWLQHELEVT